MRGLKKMAEEAAKNVVPPPSPKQRPRRTDQNAGQKPEKSVKGQSTPQDGTLWRGYTTESQAQLGNGGIEGNP